MDQVFHNEMPPLTGEFRIRGRGKAAMEDMAAMITRVSRWNHLFRMGVEQRGMAWVTYPAHLDSNEPVTGDEMMAWGILDEVRAMLYGCAVEMGSHIVNQRGESRPAPTTRAEAR